MLDAMRRGQRWLTGIFVAVIGLVFAAFIGLGGPLTRDSTSAVVELDGRQYGLLDYERVRAQEEQRLRDSIGDQFDPKSLAALLDSQALRLLVDRAVLSHAARELGLRVGKEEIQRAVRVIPGFRDELGRFDQQTFIDQVEYEYGSQRNFLEMLRGELLRQKLARLLFSQATVSDTEAESAARYALEQVSPALLVIDLEEFPAALAVEISPEEVASYRADHESELQALYEERSASFQEPERVRARHILFRIEEEASEDQRSEARSRAEAALERIQGGAAFEDVALELSEDPGSKDAGGDLGFIARGEFDADLADAAFSLDVGSVSEIVEGANGLHIVRSEERQAARTQPFEEVADELAKELARTRLAEESGRSQADRIAEAIRGGQTLEQAARAEGLTLERPDPLRRRPDGFVPGLGSAPELLATAFALDLEQSSSARVFEVEGKLAMVQLLERAEPDSTELDEAVEKQREFLLGVERNGLLQAWVDERRDSLTRSNQLLVNADAVLSR